MSFRCDVCGREVNGITIVNGMNFCAKCYQETFAIPKALSVQDLENCVKIECTQCKEKEQKIAELENLIERLKTELAELKQNAIVPKFDANDKVYHIVYDEENSYYKIESRKIILDKYYLLLTDKSPYILYKKENELFATLAEAEEALKKLEE